MFGAPLTWLHVSEYRFGTLKDGSFETDSLALNNCFSYKNVFQEGTILFKLH